MPLFSGRDVREYAGGKNQVGDESVEIGLYTEWSVGRAPVKDPAVTKIRAKVAPVVPSAHHCKHII